MTNLPPKISEMTTLLLEFFQKMPKKLHVQSTDA